MSKSKEMPLYVSHKKVRALEIEGVVREGASDAFRVIFSNSEYQPINVDRSLVARYSPVKGDFLVEYEDGYQSISPRKAFLDGYTPAEYAEPAPSADAPNFPAGLVISEMSLVTDRNGKMWWVRPQAMQIVKLERVC